MRIAIVVSFILVMIVLYALYKVDDVAKNPDVILGNHDDDLIPKGHYILPPNVFPATRLLVLTSGAKVEGVASTWHGRLRQRIGLKLHIYKPFPEES